MSTNSLLTVTEIVCFVILNTSEGSSFLAEPVLSATGFSAEPALSVIRFFATPSLCSGLRLRMTTGDLLNTPIRRFSEMKSHLSLRGTAGDVAISKNRGEIASLPATPAVPRSFGFTRNDNEICESEVAPSRWAF